MITHDSADNHLCQQEQNVTASAGRNVRRNNTKYVIIYQSRD